MAKKKTETLDEIVAKLDAAEKEYQQKLSSSKLNDILEEYSKQHPSKTSTNAD